MPQKPTVPRTCDQCDKSFQPKYRSQRFCSRPCFYAWRKGTHNPHFSGENHHWWKGGRSVTPAGYIFITLPDGQGTVAEHRYIWEQANGPIPDGYVIHHRDNNPAHNDLTNLELMSRATHAALHSTTGRWSRQHNCCIECGTTERAHAAYGLCNTCHNRRWRADQEQRPWSRKYERCIECGTTNSPHGGHGRCRVCHGRYWYAKRQKSS